MAFLQTLLINHRMRYFLIFLGCILLLGIGYILQYSVGLVPCVLCILQRLFFALVGLTALLIALYQPTQRTLSLLSGLMIVFSLVGGGLAARQIWLQHNPPSLLGSNCAPWLGSVTELIQSIFHANADCAERGWTLLSLSIPEWSGIAFLFLLIISTIPFWQKH